ncbi:phosphatidylserine decarboxylase-domain-containing protein [Gongronella butleri]|nr:phosphatidylserine decarboxylase-domain-containing protein [Gongronella butleri]
MTVEELEVGFVPRNDVESHIEDKNHEALIETFKFKVEQSGEGNYKEGIHAPSAEAPKHWYSKKLSGWVHHHLISDDFKVAVEKKYGVFVIKRDTGEFHYEEQPIFTRLGMHLLFAGHYQEKLVSSEMMHKLFLHESQKQGMYFDKPKSAVQIPSFVEHYGIDMSEYEVQDLAKYENFNAFFTRALRADVRPIASPDDDSVLVSAADCRINVYKTIDDATTFWIKGKNFTLSNLLRDNDLAKELAGGSIAIFRLAPQDYHRFHIPCQGTLESINDIDGTYYTVNPCTVREELDVFTENRRKVMKMKDVHGRPFALVAIGALLVGSIELTNAKEGITLKKGQEAGQFCYGGSTVVAVFPKDTAQWDDDLEGHSKQSFETLIKVGDRIGKFI